MYSAKEHQGIKVDGIHSQRYEGNNRFRGDNKLQIKQEKVQQSIPSKLNYSYSYHSSLDVIIDSDPKYLLMNSRKTNFKNQKIKNSVYTYCILNHLITTFSLSSTLRDVVDQLKYQIDGMYRRDLNFKIHNIYLDQHGLLKKKELGKVHSVKTRKEDESHIKQFGFKIGDCFVVEIQGKILNIQ